MNTQLHLTNLESAMARFLELHQSIGKIGGRTIVVLLNAGEFNDIMTPEQFVSGIEAYGRAGLSPAADLERGDVLMPALIEGMKERINARQAVRLCAALMNGLEKIGAEFRDASSAQDTFDLLKRAQSAYMELSAGIEALGLSGRLTRLVGDIQNRAVSCAGAISHGSEPASSSAQENLVRFLALCGDIAAFLDEKEVSPDLHTADFGRLGRLLH